MQASENEWLCRIGPDAEMGRLVRQFWSPICLSTDLPEPGGAPIRVRLFGENLVAFRGSDGVVGVLDEYCPHRGASLSLARNENCALRCIFHGWKIAKDGRLLDTPNTDNESVKARYRARAFPVEEAHGLIWTYLGPLDEIPPRSCFQWEHVPPENCLVVPVDLDANWVQCLEGLVDTSHASVLHTDVLATMGVPTLANDEVSSLRRSTAPKLEVERTDFGFHYAAIRSSESAELAQIRVTAYVAPFLCFIPPAAQAFMAVPLDDGRTRFYNIWWSSDERLDVGPGRDSRIKGWGLTNEVLEQTGIKAINPVAGQDVPRNRFRQDRAAMAANRSFSGLPGLTAEDAAVAVMMGTIASRRREHLVAADAAVIELRRLLLAWATCLSQTGALPRSLHATPCASIGAASGAARADSDWRSLVPQHMKSAARQQ
jgi:phthalate 4,5-dioxygenase oxygenase subunit